MFDKIEMMRMARAMGHHVAQRQTVVARNIANADTPGYRAQDMAAFEDSYRRTAPDMRVTQPRHMTTPDWASPARPMNDQTAMSPNGNSVSIEDEIVKAAELKRDHDLSLGIYRSALNLMRTSIGRRG
ncbi:FlgB family protein [Paracoccus sp. (in: a-proteobacteria)]|uniref:FlgB family protein n=1 Tax=Paracoccus sp. TaxID=267 RepID=UPI0026DFCF19|nr:FlgB family protein [Paracoccus sp. (in: a-proteobacteria)]MDO5648315.1 FlgB family protein [Paracoccus sp. (in: a-proteobacteria)]